MDEENVANVPESVSLKVADDAVPVCPNCFEPCDPLDNYCPNCNSNEVINPLASYMPFESIRFKAGIFGKLWRRTWNPETALIDRGIYLCLFILSCPFVALIGLSYMIFGKLKSKKTPPLNRVLNER